MRALVEIAGTPNPRIVPVCTLHEGTVSRCQFCQDAATRVACAWTESGDGPWESACGAVWEFIADGPIENQMRFCPRCGKPVQA